MIDSCKIHLPEAMMRDEPMSRFRIKERKASRRMKRRAKETFSHERLVWVAAASPGALGRASMFRTWVGTHTEKQEKGKWNSRAVATPKWR